MEWAIGHNPRTLNQPGSNSYGAGDFAINFGKDSSYDLGINIKYATGNNTFEDFGVEGGVYKKPQWAYGLWNTKGNYDPTHPEKTHPTSLLDGMKIGKATLSYATQGASGYGQNTSDLHYFDEMSIDLDLLTQAGRDGFSPF